MQQKKQKIIKLSNRSRKNRMFFDNLVRELAICIKCGDLTLNRDIELPSYRGKQTRCRDPKAVSLTKTEAVGFDTPRRMLPEATLDAIDLMLSDAPRHLRYYKSREDIADYIKQRTDLTDCHLTALNEMQLFFEPAGAQP